MLETMRTPNRKPDWLVSILLAAGALGIAATIAIALWQLISLAL